MSINDIKVIRLISGEELMGEITEDGEDTYRIKNVCQIASSYADPTSATARIGISKGAVPTAPSNAPNPNLFVVFPV